MARVQPVLTPTELALVDQMAELTHSKRTDVIKSALAVYHWFVRQALTGSKVVARKPTGEEVALETAELTALEGRGNRLGPEELGLRQAPRRGFRSRRGGADQGTSHARLLRHLGSRRADGPAPEPSASSFPASSRPHSEPQDSRISTRAAGNVARYRAHSAGGRVVQTVDAAQYSFGE